MNAATAAVAAAAAAALTGSSSPASVHHRLAVVVRRRDDGSARRHKHTGRGADETAAHRGDEDLPAVRGGRAAAAAAGLAVAVAVGGVVGIALGLGAAILARRALNRMEPRSVARQRARTAADLPTCAQLLGGAVAAGSSVLDALDVVAAAIGPPIAPHLTVAAARLRLGADPSTVWAQIDPDSGLAPLARAVTRALASGAPLADAMDRLAHDLRERRRHEIDRRARAVGVRAAAPLGLCFLPAFLLIGVIPVVIGIARQILTGVL